MDQLLDWHELVKTSNNHEKFTVEQFSRVRCYHLCRTININLYYEHGIRMVKRELLIDTFREIFSDVPEIELHNAIKRAQEHNLPEQVYVGVDCRFMLDYCGHYCVYGSEFITGLAANIRNQNNIDYRQRLKQIGRPTIIVLDIPSAFLDAKDFFELVQNLNRIKNGDYSNVIQPNMLLDFAFSFNHTLHPEWISTQLYPKSVKDPLTGSTYFHSAPNLND